MEWVVRAGIVSAGSLVKGYNQHRSVAGLFGFSVLYAPGRSIEELALAGQFPHAQISYAADDTPQTALQPLGYIMKLARSPGKGYHHTFAVLYDVSGVPLQSLPQDAAIALSQAFRQRLNPYQVR